MLRLHHSLTGRHHPVLLGLVGAARAAGLAALALLRRRHGRDHRLRALVDAAVEGLLICDGGTIVAANRAIGELLGHDADGLVGRKLAMLTADHDRLLAAPAATEAQFATAEGDLLPVEILPRTIRFAGRPHRVLAVRDLRDRKRAEASLRFLALHDPMTGMLNRAGFNAQLQAMLEAPEAQGCALLAIDLDRFKLVNNTLGHAVGDALLVKAAMRLRDGLHAGDLIGRMGGDQFAVLQRSNQPEAATALARHLVELLSRPFLVQGQLATIGASIGVAHHPGGALDAATLARQADLALYRAKAGGRGCVHVFEAELDQRLQRRRQLEVELRSGLAFGQFYLVFQPLVGARTGAIQGFEALIRWAHPERGLVAPDDFIPLAEETGLIVPIGAWVLREACREAATWPAPITIAVNLSPLQVHSPGVAELVREACAAAGLDPRRLELEITESVLLANTAATLRVLHDLKATGARIAMDDFGTGYSSLSYLRRFPFDKLKVDRSFVTEPSTGDGSAAIVTAMIGLGRSLGMQVTIEGVETTEQHAFLRDQGCDQIQGYLVGRPMLPADARRAAGAARLAA